MNKMNKKIMLNMISGPLKLIIAGLLSFFVARLTIEYFGDAMNGLIRFSTSVISYGSIAEGGIGAALLFTLYKPIADNDWNKINKLMGSVDRIFKWIGMIYGFIIVIMSVTIGFSFKNGDADIHVLLIILVVFSIGIWNIFNLFFFGKYSIFLNACNKKYLLNFFSIIVNIICYSTAITLLALHNKNPYNILFALVTLNVRNVIISFGSYIYVKVKYKKIDFIYDVSTKKELMTQMKSVLVHQIAALVVLSTDEIVLTIYSSHVGVKTALTLVSVYSIYSMVNTLMRNVIGTVIHASENQIGLDVNGKNDFVEYAAFSTFEKLSLMLIVPSVIFLSLVSPFVINNLMNPNHIKEYFSVTTSILFGCFAFLFLLKMPSWIIIISHGHYKETQRATIIEAIINLVVSLSLVFVIGIYGVLVGTIASYVFWNIYVFNYSKKVIKNINWTNRLFTIFINIAIIAISISIGFVFILSNENTSTINAILKGSAITLVSLSLTLPSNFILMKMCNIKKK